MRPLTVLIAAGLLLGGCYEEIEPEPAADSAPAAAPAGDGAHSSLGKAKESAEDTVSEVQKRNEELMKQMEDPE